MTPELCITMLNLLRKRSNEGMALEYYVTSQPSQQNAVDVFKGEWSSKFPADTKLQAGQSPLFEDSRITWLNEQIKGGLKNKTVLELGPLEGAHTWMIEQCGAKSMLAIEANSRAFLKCLITKEVMGMKNASFLLGDFNQYLVSAKEKFDVCVASGILYHQSDPLETLRLISGVSSILLLWTHYYDEAVISQKSAIKRGFTGAPAPHYMAKHVVSYYPKKYMESTGWQGFCGGYKESAHWMTREDILQSLRYFGYKEFKITLDHQDHPNGPAFAVLALKRKKDAR